MHLDPKAGVPNPMAEGERAFADFTDSESRLNRGMAIAWYSAEGPQTIQSVYRFLSSKFSIANREVARRHVKLSQRLLLVSVDNGILRLGDAGGALLFLDKSVEPPDNQLTEYDKAHLLSTILKSAPLQVGKVLQATAESGGANLKEVVVRFLEIDGSLPWSKQQLTTALSKFRRSRIVSRLFEHKVSCRVNWLRQLEIVRFGWPAELTVKGSRLLEQWEPQGEGFEGEAENITAIAEGFSPRILDTRAALTLRLPESAGRLSSLLASSLGMASYEQVRRAIAIPLLADSGAILTDNVFRAVVNEAFRKGFVRSVLEGRHGRPSSLVPA